MNLIRAMKNTAERSKSGRISALQNGGKSEKHERSRTWRMRLVGILKLANQLRGVGIAANHSDQNRQKQVDRQEKAAGPKRGGWTVGDDKGAVRSGKKHYAKHRRRQQEG